MGSAFVIVAQVGFENRLQMPFVENYPAFLEDSVTLCAKTIGRKSARFFNAFLGSISEHELSAKVSARSSEWVASSGERLCWISAKNSL